MPEPTQPKRPRGAPKGNLNALKHGLYSSRTSPDGLLHPQPSPASATPEQIPNSLCRPEIC
jgi:hypothetical protein